VNAKDQWSFLDISTALDDATLDERPSAGVMMVFVIRGKERKGIGTDGKLNSKKAIARRWKH
jgi:hypothetical protein